MISPARAQLLKPLLISFADERPWATRLEADPVELVHRYHRPRDIEVSGLLAASLAYGRADLFKPRVAGLLEQMGGSPAEFVAALTVPTAAKLLDGFVYRFHVGTDVAVLLLGMGATLRRLGSLEALFLDAPRIDGAGGSMHSAVAHFTRGLREAAPMAGVRERLGPERGLDHLLPLSLGAGAAKRLHLYLRWMVRGPDEIDFGIWKGVSTAQLIVPLDTHVHRIARLLGLTTRNDLSWRTAEDVTASLRLLDAGDPVRFDFALCHYGMSGACPARPMRDHCGRCSLATRCRVGTRLARAVRRSVDV